MTKTRQEKIAQLIVEIDKIIAASEEALRRKGATQPPPPPTNILPFPIPRKSSYDRH